MEQEQQIQQPQQPRADVGFPSSGPAKEKSKFPKWIIAVLGVIIIVGVGAFAIFRISKTSEEDGDTGTGTSLGSIAPPTSPGSTDTPAPTSSPKPENKEDIKVEVLNGTGVPGEAGFLQGVLEDLGFEDIETGNADDQDETTTTVTFSRDISKALRDEVTAELEDVYETVTSKTGALSGDLGMRVITGTRKKAAAAKKTTSPSSSPSPTASPVGEDEL